MRSHERLERPSPPPSPREWPDCSDFDSTLTAVDLIDKIKAGARTEDGVLKLDAYGALKEAAARRGAPLCGNRAWWQVNQLMVERSPATGASFDDMIFDFGPPSAPDYLELIFNHQPFTSALYHGGHRIDVVRWTLNDYVPRTLSFKGGRWIEEAPQPADPSLQRGYGDVSHDADSVVVARRIDGTRYGTVEFGLSALGTPPAKYFAPISAYVKAGWTFPAIGPELFFLQTDPANPIGINRLRALDTHTGAIRDVASFVVASEARMTTSEDGKELMMLSAGGSGDPRDCYIDFRSTANGALLRRIAMPTNQVSCDLRGAAHAASRSRPTDARP
jgi:hypothetical protein